MLPGNTNVYKMVTLSGMIPALKELLFSAKRHIGFYVGSMFSMLDHCRRPCHKVVYILWNSMTSTSLFSPSWLIQWSMGEGSYITFFSPSDVTAFFT